MPTRVQELAMREVRKMQANYVKDIAQVQKKISSLVSETLRRQYMCDSRE